MIQLIGGPLLYFLFMSFGNSSFLVSSYASLDDCYGAVEGLHEKSIDKPEDVEWYCVEAEKKDDDGTTPKPSDPEDGDRKL